MAGRGTATLLGLGFRRRGGGKGRTPSNSPATAAPSSAPSGDEGGAGGKKRFRPQISVAAEHSIKSDLSAVAIEPVEVQKGVFQVEGAKEDQRGGSRP